MRKLKIDHAITNKDQESLSRYFNDVRKYPPLSIEEEVLLAEKIRGGDESALELLVNSNLRFVVSVAKKYEAQGLLLADLIAEGNIGLMTAARHFDSARGFKFISFAIWWIRQAMQQAIDRQRRIVRLPVNQLLDIMNMRHATDRLVQQLERTPTLEELGELTGISLEKLTAYQWSSKTAVSLDTPGNDQHPNLYEVLPGDGFPVPDLMDEGSELKEELNAFLRQLPAGERMVLELSFGLGGGHPSVAEDLAERFDLSVQTIRMYKSKGLKRLREDGRFQYMKAYLSS